MADDDREEIVFNLIDKMMKEPVSYAELEAKGFEDWSPTETKDLLKALLTAGMIAEKDGRLSADEKGRFFWKRIRRKRQGFV
jgi:hypothetical protein